MFRPLSLASLAILRIRKHLDKGDVHMHRKLLQCHAQFTSIQILLTFD